MAERRSPGQVRDAIISVLRELGGQGSTTDIRVGVERKLGGPVAPSSVRSYLRLNTPDLFQWIGRGRYALRIRK